MVSKIVFQRHSFRIRIKLMVGVTCRVTVSETASRCERNGFLSDSIGIGVPPVSETNVPPLAETNVPSDNM